VICFKTDEHSENEGNWRGDAESSLNEQQSLENTVPELLSRVKIARAVGQEKNGIIHHCRALVGRRQQANLFVQIARCLVDLVRPNHIDCLRRK
jgi:hypothetical protein